LAKNSVSGVEASFDVWSAGITAGSAILSFKERGTSMRFPPVCKPKIVPLWYRQIFLHKFDLNFHLLFFFNPNRYLMRFFQKETRENFQKKIIIIKKTISCTKLQ